MASDSEILEAKKQLIKLETQSGLGVSTTKPISFNGTVIVLQNGNVQDLEIVEGKEKLWKPAAESLKKMLTALKAAGHTYSISDTYRPIGEKGDGTFYVNGALSEATQWATYEAYKKGLEVFIEGEKNLPYKDTIEYKKYVNYKNKLSAKPGTSYHGFGLAMDIFIKNHPPTSTGFYLQKDSNGKIIIPKIAVQDETQKWITDNGGTYGWIWVGSSFLPTPEAWHFEYDITKDTTIPDLNIYVQKNPQQINKTTQTQQASIFNYKSTIKLIKGCFIFGD